ncbi:hypothetical protein PVAP13_8NG229202 [Panicum virgatum]|uniref:Uncharacterized protein n=1 Tax=Panicum virgatum TaxID=38727 RepID=A0A8T0P7U2_PANVG|nr:hypothetical protein PVAP13_8NG229202 [Panicum virgatum]
MVPLPHSQLALPSRGSAQLQPSRRQESTSSSRAAPRNHASSLTSGPPLHIACFARRRWRRSRPRRSVRTAATRLLVARLLQSMASRFHIVPWSSASWRGHRRCRS